VLPSFGVQFSNKVKGVFQLQGTAPGAEGAPATEQRPLALELSGQVPNLLQAVLAPRVSLSGTITLEGFADSRPVSGQLEVQPLFGVKLALAFTDNAGADCRLETAQSFQLADAVRGKAELQGALRKGSGEPLGTVRLDVDLLASFGQFWGSLRPA